MYRGLTLSFLLFAFLCTFGVGVNSKRIVLGSFHKVHHRTSSNGGNANPTLTVNGTPGSHRITFSTSNVIKKDEQNPNHRVIVANLNRKDQNNPNRKVVLTRDPFNPNRKIILTNLHTKDPVNLNHKIIVTNLHPKDQGTSPNRKVIYTNLNNKDQPNLNSKITVSNVIKEHEDDSIQKIMLDDEINEDGDGIDDELDGEEENAENRIIGGRVIPIAEVPWQVAIIRDGDFVCGGSLISTIWVLTAGHCISGYSNSTFVVRAGSNRFRAGGQLRRVGFLVLHGRYNATQYAFDIAMMRVNRRFIYGLNVQPVSLATPYTRNPGVFFVSGWGLISQSGANPSNLLRGVSVNFINRLTCAALYSGTNYTVSRTSFCAGNLLTGAADSCDYDDGGPLVSGAIQFGIVSYNTGCGQVRRPGVYTNVGSMAPWIVAVAGTYSRRSYPDEFGEYDIRQVVIDKEEVHEPSDIRIKVTSCVNCQ